MERMTGVEAAFSTVLHALLRRGQGTPPYAGLSLLAKRAAGHRAKRWPSPLLSLFHVFFTFGFFFFPIFYILVTFTFFVKMCFSCFGYFPPFSCVDNSSMTLVIVGIPPFSHEKRASRLL